MNKGHQIFKRAQRYQEGTPWTEPTPLPSPTPDPRIYMNQWPSGFSNSTPNMDIPLVSPGDYNFNSPGMTDQQMLNQLGYDPGDPRNNLTRGFGSGVPTQRGVGTAANIAGNAVFPGLGMVTGPAASAFTRWLQGIFGQHTVQNAVQNATQGATDSGDGTAPPTPSGSVDSTTGTTTPSAGVGIDPTGNPAAPGQWWSPDFGRWSGYDQFGTTPGSYNLQGPGGGMGQRGTGFGAGTVGNLATAIGFDTLGRGGGQANFGGAWGGGPAAAQMRQIMKGIYSPMTSEGYQPLSALTGTAPLSGAQNIAGQQQLHDLLMANPGAIGGPVSGPMLRGGSRIPIQTAQKGSSNVGLNIFNRSHRLQGGKEDVSPDPTEQIKALISQYDDAIANQKWSNHLDDAMQKRMLEAVPILDKLPDQYQETWRTREPPVKRSGGQRYFDPGSLGEYPIMAQGGTNEVRGKEPPFAEDGKWWWERSDDEQGHVPLRPMSEMPDNEEDLSPEELRREQEDYKRRVKESQYIQAQKGTSNIMGMQTTANNPGMKLFMGRIKGVRPKLLLPHPSRARLPNAAQLAQSVEPPIGVKKGSSGIHIKPSHKGLFTAKAKSAGMGVQGYASKVLSEGSGASAATRRQANFARNAAKWNH